MKYTVCTTFNADGYAKYGQKMINTFLANWPEDVKLVVYAENCTVPLSAANLEVRDIAIVQNLTAFKQQWAGVPKANGDISQDPSRSKREDSKKSFKWDAVRFSHKVYSIFHCAQHNSSDVLIWMDADTICHSKITVTELDRLCPRDFELCFLGRRGKFSECGLYAMRLKTPGIQRFLQEFQRMYDQAERGIFTLKEWHDSFVFDDVRKRTSGLTQLNWSAHLSDIRPHRGSSPGEGHPLINTDWGAYLDHLKGERKSSGRSLRSDLKVPRPEAYWQ
jgi:hypothetical protein